MKNLTSWVKKGVFVMQKISRPICPSIPLKILLKDSIKGRPLYNHQPTDHLCRLKIVPSPVCTLCSSGEVMGSTHLLHCPALQRRISPSVIVAAVT
ncbi:hypothetical protein TNIN_308311 [Trichonephila inaurata madagascariensis]|uniref:Uncharacterized protein n=1 Tax=Trichonephila inaurata madagascariensis TaxID=2747483 RepID=A0A8X6XAQ7_9ARAC|nr:hypothetical protein TNIN_308311 [Trichonephila inaurata madagascariensis]